MVRGQLAARRADTAGPTSIPWRILRTSVSANAIGAVSVYLYLQYLSPGAYNPHLSKTPGVISLVVLAVYLVLSVVATTRMLGPMVLRAAAVAEAGSASADERRSVVNLPARVGWMSGAGWFGAALVFGFLNWVTFHNGAAHAARIVAGIGLGGLVTAALTATLVERIMRPLVAQVLAGEPGEATGMAALGIRARLLRAWVLGSAIPLAAIGLTPFTRRGDIHSDLVVPIAFLAGLGLVVSLLMTAATASGVGGPLRVLRRAVDAVRDGDLDIEVPVDDAGEIGMLEAGVNEMVAGLRERQRLQDLFGRHVGTEVARQALAEEAALGGLQREVSVLFVDLIGSTALSSAMPAHDVVRILNTMFACVVEAVTAEGGWVNKFEGDGAVCVFGVPGDQPDHAERALRAARRLGVLLDRAHDEEPALDAAVAVASGMAVAGNVGAVDRYEYTVIGDPVNEASRLSELAKLRPERLLASGAAVRAAGSEEQCHWSAAGTELLRGRTVPSELMGPVDHLERSTSNSLPSGSASTTQLTSGP